MTWGEDVASMVEQQQQAVSQLRRECDVCEREVSSVEALTLHGGEDAWRCPECSQSKLEALTALQLDLVLRRPGKNVLCDRSGNAVPEDDQGKTWQLTSAAGNRAFAETVADVLDHGGSVSIHVEAWDAWLGDLLDCYSDHPRVSFTTPEPQPAPGPSPDSPPDPQDEGDGHAVAHLSSGDVAHVPEEPVLPSPSIPQDGIGPVGPPEEGEVLSAPSSGPVRLVLDDGTLDTEFVAAVADELAQGPYLPPVIDRSKVHLVTGRRSGIGSSEVASLVGRGFSSPLRVALEKRGELPDRELADVDWIKWGNRLEEPIARGYATDYGMRICCAQVALRHDDYPRMTATPDFWQYSEPKGWGILEIKSVGSWNSSKWRSGAPTRYQEQLQHQLAVTGLTWGTIAALVGRQLVVYDYARDEGKILELKLRCAAFWRRYVEGDEEPELLPRDVELLRELYPQDDGSEIELPEQASSWDYMYQVADCDVAAARAALKAAETERDRWSMRIQRRMGAAAVARIGDSRYEWVTKTRRNKAREASETTYRTFRRREA